MRVAGLCFAQGIVGKTAKCAQNQKRHRHHEKDAVIEAGGIALLRQVAMFQAGLAGGTSRSNIGQHNECANGQAHDPDREHPVFQPTLPFDLVLFFSHGIDPFNGFRVYPALESSRQADNDARRPYASIDYGGPAGQSW